MKKILTCCFVMSLASTPAMAALTDQMVAYWNFDGTTDNHASASGGAAYKGTLMGNATLSGGEVKVGSGSLLLDGAGDYMDVTSIVNPNQPWSVAAWYRADQAPAGTTRYFVFETSGSFPISFGLREGANSANTNHQSYSDVVPGSDAIGDYEMSDTATAATWHHVVMTFKPAAPTATGSILVYIDGVLRNTLTIPANNTLGTANGFHIGTYRTADTRFFDGAIDEVAIWARTLSADEAGEVFMRGDRGSPLDEVLYRVDLAVSPAAAGTVTGAGVFAMEEQTAVTATAAPGYVFVGWEGEFTGQPASFSYLVQSDLQSTAVFEQDLADDDGDGLTNYEEIIVYGTDPNLADTDGDRIPDGAEVAITSTNPLVSDSALVQFVEENLCTAHGGAVALSGLGIERDPASGQLQLSLRLHGSADQQFWQDIDLSQPSVALTPTIDGWELTFPAPSASVSQYRILGSKP